MESSRKHWLKPVLVAAALSLVTIELAAADVNVTNIQAVHRNGLPWQFTVEERVVANTKNRRLLLNTRETMAQPDGDGTRETYWFGYYCSPPPIPIARGPNNAACLRW